MEPDHTVHHTLDMQLNIFSINRFSIAHAKKKHATIFAYLHLHTGIKMFIYLPFCVCWNTFNLQLLG